MKSASIRKSILLFAALFVTGSALAVTPAEDTEKVCIKPKFRDFAPEPKSEVAPETEISFHVSRGAEPASITADAKTEKMAVKVVDRVNFLYVTAKLPASLQSGFARIHISAKAAEGGCLGQDGWLIKIKGPDAASEGHQEKH